MFTFEIIPRSVRRSIYKLAAGDISRLRISEESLASPLPNEVTIEVKSIGLNFADVFAILGLYAAAPKEPFIPGLEFSGLVLKTGSEVHHVQAGDKIMGVTHFGAYTSHLNVDGRYVLSLPNGWSFEEGSAYLVQVLTAYYGLVSLGNIQEKSTVLIHSGAGGVGIWANRIAKFYNAFTIGTVGSTSKLDILKQEGFDGQIVRNSRNFEAQLNEVLNGRELNLVMECIGGKILETGYRRLSDMGRMIVYGSAHYSRRADRPFWPLLAWKYLNRPKVDPQSMIGENKSIMAFNLIYLFDHMDFMHGLLGELELLKMDKPLIGHRFHFDELPTAIRLFQSGNTIGKLVVTI